MLFRSVKLDKHNIPSIIGKGGSTINELEKRLKVHIDVVEKGPSDETTTDYELPFTFSESKSSVILSVSREYTGMHADVFVDHSYITSSRIGRKGQIKIPRRSDAAKKLMKLATSQNDIQIFLKDF